MEISHLAWKRLADKFASKYALNKLELKMEFDKYVLTMLLRTQMSG